MNDGTASSSCQVQVWVEIRPICTLTQSAPSPVRSPVTLDLTVDNVVTWPPDATFEYTADGGLTWTQALPTAASTNPMTLPPMPPPFMFEWDSLGQAIGVIAPATGIEMRATITSGPLSNTCETAPFDVDNTVACSLTVLSPSPVTDQVDVEVQPDSPSSPVVDITFDYSVDGGATWLPASPAGGHTNPVLGAAVMTPTSWSWDSRGDGVGVASLQAGVLLRASLEDAVVIAPSTCESPPFEVDNTSLCPGDCGDCDESGSPSITVLDALVAAQISAGVVLASPAQEGCCDVNDSLSITVIDALLMAQTGVGLTVTLGCP